MIDTGLRRFRKSVIILGVALLLGVTHPVWLAWAGNFLVRTDPIEAADIVVVLAGDGSGRRLLRAVELVGEGYAPRVLIPGPQGAYGVRESDLALQFARREGLDMEVLEGFPIAATSTLEELALVERELRRRGVNKALVVTSNFHTRRARSIYRGHTSGAIDYIFVAADHPEFDPDSWWKTRDGKEVLVIEYIKTLNSWVE